MRKLFLLTSFAFAAFGSVAHAADESDHWFNNGAELAWYQHPCGFAAFTKYGQANTPENRANYYYTIKHPEACSKLFP